MLWRTSITLSVGGLLHLGFPPGTKVLTGDVGLDREVVMPVVLRTRAPAFDALTGGEFALISADAVRLIDERLTLEQVIDGLASRGVAAVGVLGPVDPTAVIRATERQLPLVHLPDSTNLYEFEQWLGRLISQQRAALYSLGSDVQRRLAELSMKGHGIQALLTYLAEVTRCAVALAKPGPILLEVAIPPGAPIAESDISTVLASLWPLTEASSNGHIPLGDSEPAIERRRIGCYVVLYTRMTVRDLDDSVLALVGPAAAVEDAQRVAFGRARVVCAMELAKQEAIVEAEQRLRGDLVAELIDGPITSEELVFVRAQRLGYDLRRPVVVLVATATPTLPRSEATSTLEAGVRLVRARQPAVPFTIRDLSIVVIAPLDDMRDTQPARAIADLLLSEPSLRQRLSLGLGRIQPGIARVRDSYREAEQAATIGHRLFGAGHLVAFQDLGAYRLLFALTGSPELRAFHDETLGPLIQYDARNGTELVHTLEMYFAHRANLKETADALFLHRNSLAYRLRRIAEVTGYNLDDIEDRFRLQLALKARQLLSTSPSVDHSLAGAQRVS